MNSVFMCTLRLIVDVHTDIRLALTSLMNSVSTSTIRLIVDVHTDIRLTQYLSLL